MSDVKLLERNIEVSPEDNIGGFVNPFAPKEEVVDTPAEIASPQVDTPPPTDEGNPPATDDTPPPPPAEATPPPPAEPIDHWKELGIDEYERKLIDARRAGKLDEFVSIKNANYDNMSDVELLRLKLSQEYPTLSKEKLDVLYNKKLSSYSLGDDFDDDAQEIGRIMLEADMLAVREGLKAKQKEYTVPSYTQTPQDTQEQERARQAEFLNHINSLPEFQQFDKDRVVKFGDVNYAVPNDFDLKRATVDVDYFFSKYMNPDKSLKTANWMKAAAYASNPEMVEKALIDYGKALGRKESDEALRNPSNRATVPDQSVNQPRIQFKGWV